MKNIPQKTFGLFIEKKTQSFITAKIVGIVTL